MGRHSHFRCGGDYSQGSMGKTQPRSPKEGQGNALSYHTKGKSILCVNGRKNRTIDMKSVWEREKHESRLQICKEKYPSQINRGKTHIPPIPRAWMALYRKSWLIVERTHSSTHCLDPNDAEEWEWGGEPKNDVENGRVEKMSPTVFLSHVNGRLNWWSVHGGKPTTPPLPNKITTLNQN